MSGVNMSLNHTPYFSRSEPWSWYIALVDIHKIKKGDEVRGYLVDWHTSVRILKNDIHAEPITEPDNECWIPCEQLVLRDKVSTLESTGCRPYKQSWDGYGHTSYEECM